ncbi:MAG TPA: murein biosynthesis integral membrane protein MurJ [Nitrolancea sp.]|nr:murein biosynthesis integral membrane protein MurJ [Nitrolancea sp.]
MSVPEAAEEAAEISAATAGSDRRQIAKAAAIIMVGTILSRVLGLGREQITAVLFGTGNEVAAFTIADNIHTMLFDLVISGMMQAALVPVLSAYAAPEQRAELRRITGALLMLALIVVGSAVLLMELLAPAVVSVMTSLGGGAEARGEDIVALTVQLVRMILPTVLLLAFSTILMSTLYALQRFTRPALALAVRNAAIVAAALTLGRTVGIQSLVIGILIGALLLALLQLSGLRDAMPQLNFGFRHPAIRRILALYLPISVGLIGNTIALVIDRNLAWGVGADALGAMRYATALNQMILGIVAAAISLAALPTLSRHFTAKDEAAFQRTLSNGLKMVTVLVVPATFGLAAIAWPAVSLLFFHGETHFQGAHAIWIALLAYLPGTFFAAFDQVLIFAYYARQNTRTPVIVGVLAVGVYLLVALSLVSPLGMAGLVLANSAQFTFHAIVMWFLLRRALGQVGDRTVTRTLWAALTVGVVMAAAAYVTVVVLQSVLHPGQDAPGLIGRLALVVLPVGLGAIIYAGGLHLLGIEEIRDIQRGITRRIGRLTG